MGTARTANGSAVGTWGLLQADVNSRAGRAAVAELRDAVDGVAVVEPPRDYRDDKDARRDTVKLRRVEADGGPYRSATLLRFATIGRALAHLPALAHTVVLADAEAVRRFGAHFVADLVRELHDGSAAVVRGQQVTDALKEVDREQLIRRSVPREGLVSPAMPQVVRLDRLGPEQIALHETDLHRVVPALLSAGHRIRIHAPVTAPVRVRRVD